MARILALLDGSIYAQSVCDHAAWLGSQGPSSIELMHVLGRRDVATASPDLSGNLLMDTRDTLLAELAALDEQKARLSQRRGRAILDEAKARFALKGIEVATKLRHGDLIDALHDLEPTTDMVVIGKRGEAADFAKLHLGSNLERTVRATTKPVLVASRSFKPIEHVLVAFDGGPSVNKAVAHMAESPLFKGLEVRLLMAGSETAEGRRQIEAAAAKLNAAGIRAQAEIVTGEPDAVIVKAIDSHAINLLVMGAYGHSRIRSLIIGSTTTEMIRSCAIPVMLFR
ncbi:universal stress protein UspA [Bosea sp. AAP35]|uniref:universal stress protein n=1 Tax=Bosea sp. AAP35 TaxID=1523417 RepID=UPI0006B9CA1B|nr:universal stress protein [Bosea sp. AAP35]KPF73168.1 universal stress protein UspA [Bosea sp. AAP35]